MPTHTRPYAGVADQQRMAELVREYPEGNLHVADLPYRLSSWAFDHPENIGLWEDQSGRLIAWVVLQAPFWAIDYVLHPRAEEQGLLSEVLSWACRQARQVAARPGGRPMWFAYVTAGRLDRQRALEAAGFYSIEHDPQDPWSGLYLARGGQTPVPAATLPDGFTIRPLAGATEVAAYVELHRAAFGSDNMTVAWRARTLERPEYLPDLDLVVEAPAGRLAAFCVGWISTSGHGDALIGQIEPLGVHPDYRQLGLGRAVLLEALRRLGRRGVATIVVETDDFRDAAVTLYTSTGFSVAEKILIYRKDVVDTR